MRLVILMHYNGHIGLSRYQSIVSVLMKHHITFSARIIAVLSIRSLRGLTVCGRLVFESRLLAYKIRSIHSGSRSVEPLRRDN